MKKLLAKTLICDHNYSLEAASATLGLPVTTIKLMAEEQGWSNLLPEGKYITPMVKEANDEVKDALLANLETQELSNANALSPFIFDSKIALAVKLRIKIDSMDDETDINSFKTAASTLRSLEAEFVTKTIGKSTEEDNSNGITINILNQA